MSPVYRSHVQCSIQCLLPWAVMCSNTMHTQPRAQEYNDGLLVAYLAAITKSTSDLSQVIGKLSMTSSGGGPMGRSMMFMLS